MTSRILHSHIPLILLAVAVLTGCASPPPPPGLRVERTSVGSVVVRSVHLRAVEKGLTVSGEVRRGLGYSSTLRSHLDVDVIGPGGELRHHVPVRYIPYPIRHSHRMPGRSDYAVTLREVPAPGSIVRVSHHPISISECH